VTLEPSLRGRTGPHSGSANRPDVTSAPSGRSAAEATSYQRLREHLAYLQLGAAAENLSAELDRGLREKASATQVLERLLEIQVETPVLVASAAGSVSRGTRCTRRWPSSTSTSSPRSTAR
jgi:hypothetical protein